MFWGLVWLLYADERVLRVMLPSSTLRDLHVVITNSAGFPAFTSVIHGCVCMMRKRASPGCPSATRISGKEFLLRQDFSPLKWLPICVGWQNSRKPRRYTN